MTGKTTITHERALFPQSPIMKERADSAETPIALKRAYNP